MHSPEPSIPLKPSLPEADPLTMGRSVIGLCAVSGVTVGGFVPALWGASAFSLSSLALSALGGIAGVWLGARLTNI